MGDGKTCAENPALNDAETQLIYSASIGTYEHSEAVVTAPAMLFSSITCKYVENGDIVVLGDKVKIVFTSASSLLDIHIQECFAHNNKYKKEDDGTFKDPLDEDVGFNELQLVDNDCFETGGNLDTIKPLTFSEPCIGESCTAFTFNQFAFTDTSSDSTDPTLTFHMTCKIAIGTADTAGCTRRRRQAGETSSDEVSFSFEVEKSDVADYEVQNGIVTLLDEVSSADRTALPVCSLLAFLAYLV